MFYQLYVLLFVWLVCHFVCMLEQVNKEILERHEAHGRFVVMQKQY